MTLSRTTKDHDEIRKWAESRGAVPAEVAGTEKSGEPGILRFEFPKAPNHNDSKLKEIPWDDFFEKFDENDLELVYQEKTADGDKSNFNKLVHPSSEDHSSRSKSHSGSSSQSARTSKSDNEDENESGSRGSKSRSSSASHGSSAKASAGNDSDIEDEDETTISMTILKRRPEPMIWMTMESLGTPLRKARRASPERRRIQEDHLPRAARLPVAQRASQVQAAASRPVRRRSKRVHIRAEGSSARSHYPPRAASSRPWRRISPR